MSYARRFVTLALVICLVSTSAFAPVGTVAASHGDCGSIDKAVAFVSFAAMYDVWGDESSTDCIETHYDEVVEEMQQSDANQTKTDIYNAGAATKGQLEGYQTTFSNYLKDTDSVVWMKVEKAVAEAYQDGKSKAEAKTAARQAISGYYATKQKNTIEQWNVTIGQSEVINEQSVMEDGIGAEFVNVTHTHEDTSEPGAIKHMRFTQESVTLVNGSQVDSKAVQVKVKEETNHNTDTQIVSVSDGETKVRAGAGGGYGAYTVNVTGIRVNPPNSNYNKLEVINFTTFADNWASIEQKNDALQSEAEQFVEATWADYDSGAINASDVISSHTAMWEYGVRSGNESEGLWRSTAALAMMGYDTPNLNQSGTMTVEYLGQNYTGVVMAENAPGGSWEVGKTYDPSAIDGPVFMATTAGEKRDFTNNFTITGMTARDGTQINSTETTKYVYKTANTSQMLEMQEQMTELRQEIEDREQNGVGGDSDGGGLDLSREQLIGVAALAAVALLAGGGRRRAG